MNLWFEDLLRGYVHRSSYDLGELPREREQRRELGPLMWVGEHDEEVDVARGPVVATRNAPENAGIAGPVAAQAVEDALARGEERVTELGVRQGLEPETNLRAGDERQVLQHLQGRLLVPVLAA